MLWLKNVFKYILTTDTYIPVYFSLTLGHEGFLFFPFSASSYFMLVFAFRIVANSNCNSEVSFNFEGIKSTKINLFAHLIPMVMLLRHLDLFPGHRVTVDDNYGIHFRLSTNYYATSSAIIRFELVQILLDNRCNFPVWPRDSSW